MKKHNANIFAIVLIIFPGFLFAQNQAASSWLELMQDNNASFYDIQKAFYADSSNLFSTGARVAEEEESEDEGGEQFKRYEYYASPRVYPSGDRSLLARKPIEYASYLKSGTSRRMVNPVTQAVGWSYFCPSGIPNGAGAGRVNCVTVDPANSTNMWLGAADGGVWKSTNSGASYSTTTDFFNDLGVSDIAIAPGNSQVMYVATGDRDGFFTGGSHTYTYGIMKSTDGGASWNQVYSLLIANTGIISRILIDPSNIQNVYASGSFGIIKSSDGGASWSIIKPGQIILSMEFKPGNSSTIYAAGKTFFVSNDAGATWTASMTGLQNNPYRMSIAVTPANPAYVYVLSANINGKTSNGVYRSTNSGASFTQRYNGGQPPNIMGFKTDGSDAGAGQSFYTNTIAANPFNAEEVMVGGVNIWKSLDGGSTWGSGSISQWRVHTGGTYVHADIHHILYLTGTNVLVGCDGGIFNSSSGGSSWSDISTNLQIGQIYGMGMSTTNPNLVLSGWQDNGTNLMTTATSWAAALGSDGMKCFVDWSNDNNMWGEQFSGGLHGTTNGGASWNNLGTASSENTAWCTPWKQDPSIANAIYCGNTNLYRSADGGNTWSRLGTQPDQGSYINEFAIAPSNSNIIYVSKNTGVTKTTDGGVTWSILNIPFTNAVTYIAVCPTDPNIVYLTISGYNSGQKVYVSSDGGDTWINFSTGLPNLPANCITYQKNSPGSVYLGMDVGIYYRDSTLSTWVPYNQGLPNVEITQIAIYYPTGTLRAATYGRGIWQAPIYVRAVTPPVAVFSLPAVTPCAGTQLNFTDNSSGSPFAWNWSFPGAVTTSSTAQNPSGIVYATAGTYTVGLQVSNAAGVDSARQVITILTTPAVPVVTQAGNVLSTTATGVTYQWYLNGILIAGATGQSYTATTIPGNYMVVVTNPSGCSASSSSIMVTTGIRDLSATNLFEISPNPSNGIFDVKLDVTEAGSYELNLYNSIGQLLLSEKMISLSGTSHRAFDLTKYGCGVYLLSLTDSHRVSVKKAIVY